MHLDPSILASYLSACVAFASLIFVIISFNRTSKKDSTEAVRVEEARYDSVREGMVKVNVKLDQICSTINETRNDVKKLAEDTTNLQVRITSIEERIAAMNVRIKDLEHNVYHYGGDES